MTRKQMEQKIEELSAELAELKKAQSCHCHGTCVHWHYQSLPTTIYPTTALPWNYTVYTGGSSGWQITGGNQAA